MDPTDTHWLEAIWPFLLFSAAGLILLVLLVTRQLSPATLRRGPVRDVGWGPTEWAAAVVLASLFALPLAVSWLPRASPDAVLIQVVQSLGFFAMWGGIAFLIARLARSGHLRLGGVVPRQPGRDLLVAAAAIPVALVLAMALGACILIVWQFAGQALPDEGHEVIRMLKDPQTTTTTVVVLAIAAIVIAPVTEEFFFRGFLQTAFQSAFGHDKRWASILTVSLFFGIIHLGAVPPVLIPVLVLLGVVFGWVYERTGSLWCAVLVHAGYNATNVTMSLL